MNIYSLKKIQGACLLIYCLPDNNRSFNHIYRKFTIVQTRSATYNFRKLLSHYHGNQYCEPNGVTVVTCT